MKLFRFGPKGAERSGIVRDEGVHLDVSAFGEDIGERFFEHDGLRRLADFVAYQRDRLPQIPEGARLGPCIARPSKIAHISEFMTLLPGDVIATGTPEGVGSGQVPPVFLAAGDLVEYSISGLGEARQQVEAEGA